MNKKSVKTAMAPMPVGTYSQAIKAGQTVYLASQAPFVPATMQTVDGGIEAEIQQVLENLKAVAKEAGGSLNDIVKVTVYLTDLDNFPLLNKLMGDYFNEPYPARAVVGVAAMPKGTQVGIDGIMVLDAN